MIHAISATASASTSIQMATSRLIVFVLGGQFGEGFAEVLQPRRRRLVPGSRTVYTGGPGRARSGISLRGLRGPPYKIDIAPCAGINDAAAKYDCGPRLQNGSRVLKWTLVTVRKNADYRLRSKALCGLSIWVSSEVHSAAGRHGWSGALLFRQLSDHRLGGDQEAGN